MRLEEEAGGSDAEGDEEETEASVNRSHTGSSGTVPAHLNVARQAPVDQHLLCE